MMIYEALADIGVPVCHPPYKGAEETYITYQLLGQSGQIYAEGRKPAQRMPSPSLPRDLQQISCGGRKRRWKARAIS